MTMTAMNIIAPTGDPGDAVALEDFPPRGDFDFSRSLFVLSDPTGVQAESIRVLRAHIVAKHLREGRRSLAMATPSEGSGCSFVTANLAVALAQTGVNVLLIDGNMRKPGLHELIAPTAGVFGLSDCLGEANVPFADAVQEDVLPHLSLLYAGDAREDASELLSGAEFKSLIEHCIRDYDLVLIDTPPANAYADVRRVASITRYAMLVVCRNKSYVRDVRTLVEELTSDKSQVIGTYLNGR
ncbi:MULTISPECIES: CpsD/CapB family tyrosine-protein kinase [unclassified Sphingomonas]|uniref:CpsD/CapB family tyrosine-protein kinase n=1 Tax=unclassified Sphingomonas TaxID=196159 RepID=UPI001AC2A4A2|nr:MULTISPECIES: CpsD/CapB family tyrosine-protein kinase [unclassified Sphingomonas]MBN8848685.1 CpsD/CapB family tyrosine-protein kinase [Sphingomonas sp.]